MKTFRNFFLGAGSLLILCMVLVHLGPHLHLSNQNALAHLKLGDGSRLLLLETANPSVIDAFTVELFRLYPNGGAEKCLVGSEESHWWFGKLVTESRSVVQLRSMGTQQCK